MKKVTGVITWIFIILLSIITVFPFIYMVLGGLMSYAETTSIPPTIIPHHLHFENYVQVFHQAPFLKYFWNTLLTSSIDTVCVLITSLFAAFALTSLDFKGKKAIKILMISLLMVPSEAIIFTNYNTIAKWGLLNTYVGLFLPFTTSVFYILLKQILPRNSAQHLPSSQDQRGKQLAICMEDFSSNVKTGINNGGITFIHRRLEFIPLAIIGNE